MPSTPTEFTLNADVFRLIADTADVGADMDMPAITGLEIYFDPDVDMNHLLAASTTPRAMLIKPERVTGYIRSNGRMYDQPATSAVPSDITDPGNVGVRLLASGAELNLQSTLTYRVSSNEITLAGSPWSFTSWHIPAPTTDVTVDLASLAPVSASTAETILRGPAGVGADAVRLSGGNVIFSYQGVDLPNPLAIASASVPDGSVTTVKIVDANVTLAKLSSGVQTSLGKADTALQSLATDSVGSTQIAVNAVGASELADNSVDTNAIVNAAVTLAKTSSSVQTSLGKADTAAQVAGDLGGTSATPAVVKVNGVTISGTPASGQVPAATSTTAATWRALTKTDVGLDQVDNVSDVNKPVSSAQSSALTTKIDKSLVTTKGDVIVATGSATPTRLPVGADNLLLTADAAQASGIKWAALAANTVDSTQIVANAVTTVKITDANVTLAKLSTGVQTSLGKADTAAQIAGDLGGTSAAPTVSKVNGIAVSGTPSAGDVPTATGSTAATWQPPVSGFANPLTTAGDIMVRNATTTVRKAIGTNQQVLRVNTANADKLEYATLSIGIADLSATGTKDATTVLFGDNVFRVPTGGTTVVNNNNGTLTFATGAVNNNNGTITV